MRTDSVATYEIAMQPLMGYLALESEPPGASVYVDGEKTDRVTPIIRLCLGQPLPIRKWHEWA